MKFQSETRTATVELFGETREFEFSIRRCLEDGREWAWTRAFVGTIGAGKAKYPVQSALIRLAEDEAPRGYSVIATDEKGDRWTLAMSVVIRNRQGWITGWSDEATNDQNQSRKG